MVAMLFLIGLPQTWADNSFVQWERIEGVTVPGSSLGPLKKVVGGVNIVAFSWSTTKGKASVNLQNGKLHFFVQGLVLAAQNSPTGGLVISSPSPGVTEVKGTIVCNASEPAPFTKVVLVDSDPVPLSPQGEANFHGNIELPSMCDDVAFLLTTCCQPWLDF